MEKEIITDKKKDDGQEKETLTKKKVSRAERQLKQECCDEQS
jgi:hypothetical protein